MPKNRYIGRFAPSPTGELHFGSLVAAVGSFLQARINQGLWRVRIEDIDPPREVEGSARRILDDLHRLGMKPDGAVLYQSERDAAYADALKALLLQRTAFYCRCSRRVLPTSGVYPGTCREADLPPDEVRRIRLRVARGRVGFDDRIMGHFDQDLASDVGDFVICRADGMPAYQLAVVIDDHFQEITEVVRGADLLDSTPRQIAVQRALNLREVAYCHLPLATLPDGSKLSKRLGSDPVKAMRPAEAIYQALVFLGQSPPRGLELDLLWAWAIQHWNIDRVPRHAALPSTMAC
jgi:glutamyl-Q tRNA(Asp) synthetase